VAAGLCVSALVQRGPCLLVLLVRDNGFKQASVPFDCRSPLPWWGAAWCWADGTLLRGGLPRGGWNRIGEVVFNTRHDRLSGG